MRRITLWLTIALATFAFGTVLATVWFLKLKHRESDLLIHLQSTVAKVTDLDDHVGPVHSIYAEVAKFSYKDDDGKWVEYPKYPFQKSEFDVSGKKVRQIQYIMRDEYIEGPPVTYDYDQSGRLIRENLFTIYGYAADEVTYSYNDSGKLIEEKERNLDRDGKVLSRTTYYYDWKSNYVETANYDWEIHLRSRQGYLIKPSENTVETFDPSDPIRTKVVSKYDANGNILERYLALSGGPRAKRTYEYQFDYHGNWIKQVASEWVEREGKGLVLEPQEVTYRTITYY
jgi:hypothetical protein